MVVVVKIKQKPVKVGNIKRNIPYDIDNTFNSFATTLENTPFNLDIFYKNIKNVNIIEAPKKELSNPTIVAEYDIFHNKIRYLKKYYKIGIFHELFHLASTIIGKKRIYSGFFQLDKKTKEFVGFGLNEAYSAILDERYFGDCVPEKKDVVGKTYFIIKYLTSMIEEAVGRENMEEWYSTCDLETLTNTLAYATDYESTLMFYQCLDNILILLESKKFYQTKIKAILSSYEYASIYIARLYLDVIERAYIEEEITDNEYEDFLLDLKEQLQKPLIIGKYFKKRSAVLNDEEFESLVQDTMKKSLKKYT